MKARDCILNLLPKLTNAAHKGQCGRVGIIGGCEEYTGAPYFAAMSALRMGVDLVHVFCEQDAAQPIKAYSPDLIVHGYLSRDPRLVDASIARIRPWLDRLHCLVVGPGAGRDECMLRTMFDIIGAAKEIQLPVIVDADGLYLLSKDPSIIQDYPLAIITPNVAEFGRLCVRLSIDENQSDVHSQVQTLARQLGVTVFRKGQPDIISDGHLLATCSEPNQPRRVGGQGDVLSGAIAAFAAWNKVLKLGESNGAVALAGSHITRVASDNAFCRSGRSMITSDVLGHIADAVRSVETSKQ